MPVVTAGIRIDRRGEELPRGEVAVEFDPAESEVDFPGLEVADLVYDQCGAVIDVSWPPLFSLFDVPVEGAGLSLAGERESSYDFYDENSGTLVIVDLFIDADNPANCGLWAAYGVRGPGDRRRLIWCDGDNGFDVVQALFDATGLCCSCRVQDCPGYRIMAGHIAPGDLPSYQPGTADRSGDARRLTLAHGGVVFAYLLRLGAAADGGATDGR